MQKLVTLVVLLALWTPAQSRDTPSRESDELRQLVDRAAIHEVMQKYMWSADSLDADGYVSVFTEDAVVDANGDIHKGLTDIRKVVTGLQARQAANREKGQPPGNLYHVISNERISFISPTEALYQSYWQTLRKSQDKDQPNRYIAGGFGRSEDRLVKRDGRWLIQSRKLVVFTD